VVAADQVGSAVAAVVRWAGLLEFDGGGAIAVFVRHGEPKAVAPDGQGRHQSVLDGLPSLVPGRQAAPAVVVQILGDFSAV
jgi:hypothetical protein